MSEYKYIQLCGFKGHPMANKNGVILEHRLVMSIHIGRMLTSKDVVHHKNGDRTDNRISNLLLTNQSEHARGHKLGTRKFIDLTCARCSTVFERPFNQVTTKLKNGQENFYCSIECMRLSFKKKKLPV